MGEKFFVSFASVCFCGRKILYVIQPHKSDKPNLPCVRFLMGLYVGSRARFSTLSSLIRIRVPSSVVQNLLLPNAD